MRRILWTGLMLGMTLLANQRVEAQTRTWSFSRDTVYEYSSASGSVTLSNQGTDTLRFDTVQLEIVRPAISTYGVGFSKVPGNAFYVLNCSNGSCSSFDPTVHPKAIRVPPNQSVVFEQFYIDLDGLPLVAKRASSNALGDTLQARMIFKASAGRGSDTLLIKGTQQTTAIRVPAKRNEFSAGSDVRLFDMRGRRLESIPDGLKAIRAPAAARE